MKRSIFFLLVLLSCISASAQYEDAEKKGFKKENLFSGGTISLSFFNNSFLIGANPIFGYRIADFIDAGVVINFQYTSYHDYMAYNDKLNQSIYGGGVFTRLYPVNFLFGHLQYEHNFFTQKYVPAPNSGLNSSTAKTSANSVLVGGGYTSGRGKHGNNSFFYLSLLFDISGNSNSPYTDAYGRSVPIIRAGFNIGLYQGHRGGY